MFHRSSSSACLRSILSLGVFCFLVFVNASASSSYFHSPFTTSLSQNRCSRGKEWVKWMNSQPKCKYAMLNQGRREFQGRREQCQLQKVRERKEEVRKTMISCLKDWIEGCQYPLIIYKSCFQRLVTGGWSLQRET